mgnify:CR=1 FL=1
MPKVAATPDGGCYVGWYDLASGNYDVYLQRLDAAGVARAHQLGLKVMAYTVNDAVQHAERLDESLWAWSCAIVSLARPC